MKDSKSVHNRIVDIRNKLNCYYNSHPYIGRSSDITNKKLIYSSASQFDELKEKYPFGYINCKDAKIIDMPFSPRAKEALLKSGLRTLAGILRCQNSKIIKIKGLGYKSFKEIFKKTDRILRKANLVKTFRNYSNSSSKKMETNELKKAIVKLNYRINEIQNKQLDISNINKVNNFIKSMLLGDETFFKDQKRYSFFILRFGFLNDKKMTLQEIADIYELSRERIRQIIYNSLLKLDKLGLSEIQRIIENKIHSCLIKNRNILKPLELFNGLFNNISYFSINKENFIDFFLRDSKRVIKVDRNGTIYYKLTKEEIFRDIELINNFAIQTIITKARPISKTEFIQEAKSWDYFQEKIKNIDILFNILSFCPEIIIKQGKIKTKRGVLKTKNIWAGIIEYILKRRPGSYHYKKICRLAMKFNKIKKIVENEISYKTIRIVLSQDQRFTKTKQGFYTLIEYIATKEEIKNKISEILVRPMNFREIWMIISHKMIARKKDVLAVLNKSDKFVLINKSQYKLYREKTI